jgi:hypothetical protein
MIPKAPFEQILSGKALLIVEGEPTQYRNGRLP